MVPTSLTLFASVKILEHSTLGLNRTIGIWTEGREGNEELRCQVWSASNSYRRPSEFVKIRVIRVKVSPFGFRLLLFFAYFVWFAVGIPFFSGIPRSVVSGSVVPGNRGVKDVTCSENPLHPLQC